jgi:hypothetical protein
MRTLRERLTLVLLALLPFHALGVTVLTRVVAGPDNAPMGALALWKEAVLAAVLLVAMVEIAFDPALRKKALRFDAFDFCVDVLALSLFVATFLGGVGLGQAAYGIRYDLVPLAAFVILRRVPWSDAFLQRLPFVLGGAVLAAVAYGLLTLAMPASFFTALGYSDLHSLYVPSGPVAPFQQIGGTALRRMQGAMSGPNQFGIWLAALLPVVLALGGRWRRFVAPLALLGIVLTFSRAAWIAAAAVLLVSFWPLLRKLSVTAVTILCVGILALSVAVLAFFPSVILRIESSADHLRNPIEALGIMVREPLGRGLGSAGPANNRVSDACVFLEEGSDASWAAPHADLCVFVGDAQVQPVGKECSCPLLPENWYLQLGVEGGWIAMFAFIVLVAILIRRLWPTPPAMALMAASIAALFLHAWEDAAVAYTVWILCAITLTFWSAKISRD